MDISNQQEFLSLSVDRLADLLRNDLLRVKSEEMVFEAILRWIEYDRCSRKHLIVELFREVRFGLMTPSYLTNRVLREELVQQDSECRDLVLQVLQQPTAIQDLDLPLKEREVNALYIFGGYVNNGANRFEKLFIHRAKTIGLVQYLDCAMGNTNLEEFPPIRCASCHVASLGQFIYWNFVDTHLMTKCNKLTLECEHITLPTYNVDVNKTVNSMSCACQQFMYIIGGSCYRRFNTATDLWQRLPLPVSQHYRPGVCCLKDKVYVIGGCDKFYQDSVNCVERFDAVNKAWETLSPLPTARWGVGVAVMNSKIYVAGGYDTDRNCPLNTVEVYDPANDAWASVASLVHPRRRFGVAVVNGVIYVAGGYDEESVEWYDNKNDQWIVLEGATVNRHDFICLALPVPHCL